MNKMLMTIIFALSSIVTVFAQKVEYKIITSVESVVPMGIGRSMMVENVAKDTTTTKQLM